MQITVDGLSIRYQDRGEGRPLLFLHGWGTEAATYHLILDHLSARFRIIAPDLPGFGGSEQPPAPWGVEEYAAFVRHFLEAVGVRPEVVMGHSNGGRILLYLLSETPPALPAGQAVLIDSAGIRPKHGFGWYVRVYSYKAAKRFVTLAPVRRLWPELEARAKAHFGSADYQRADERMRQTLVRLVNSDLSDRLPRIAASTLLIWGEDDEDTPLADAKLMEQRIPDAGLVVLKGDHFAFAEQWPQCRAVLDSFLPG